VCRGAGIIVDSSDNLYITGGTTVTTAFDTTSVPFIVLSDMLTFQLRDPFYKYCSATGAGLFAAVAGINTPFFIQCRDIFGDPANSASIRVDITGKVSRTISLSTLWLIDAVFEIDGVLFLFC
jgi:hypothetical protein